MQANHNIKTTSSIIQSLYKEGGLIRFWKGSSVIAAGCVPAHAAYFSVYEYAKKHFGVEDSGYQFIAAGLTGAVSTFVHDSILTPYDGNYLLIIL